MTPTELTQGENCGTLYPRIVQESVRTSRREAQENVHVTTEVDLVVGQLPFMLDGSKCTDAVYDEAILLNRSLEALEATPCPQTLSVQSSMAEIRTYMSYSEGRYARPLLSDHSLQDHGQ